MTKYKKLVVVLGIAVVLSSLAIPLSSAKSKSAWRQESVNLSIGIAEFIGVKVVSNTAGEGVAFNDGIYSKTMVNGEDLANFGTTRLRIYCNIETDDNAILNGRNCKDDGWSLNVTPTSDSIVSKGGASYAAMTKTTDSDAILSSSNPGTDSNWTIKVSPVEKSVKGTPVSASVTSGYQNPHYIPASTTPIATSTSWRTIGGVSTFIESFEVDVQYGVNVSHVQSSGTYTSALDYTVSLNAAS